TARLTPDERGFIMPVSRRLALIGALLSLTSAAAIAQAPAGGDGALVFQPDFFAAAHPADAYDMIRRLPGFTLIEGDEDVRGFGGARGNVLFDGRAPASKEESLAELL